eukprot:3605737-Amphidinium_carterae.3
MPWALYNRKNKQKHASGSRCWSCATVAAKGFRELSWPQLVSLVKTDNAMAKTLQVAKSVLAGARDGANWLEEQVFEEHCQTFRIEESFNLVSESDFEKIYNVKAKQPEVAKLFQNIPGLVGKDAAEKFIVMKEDERQPRKLILETSGTLNCQTRVMPSTEQLRAQQGKDLLAYLEQKRPGPKGLTLEGVKKAVEAAEAAAKATAAASPAEQTHVVAEPAPLAALEKDKDDEDEESEDIDMVQKPMMPGDEVPMTGQGKGKGRGKKGKAGRGSKRASDASVGGMKRPRLALSPKKPGLEEQSRPSVSVASVNAAGSSSSRGPSPGKSKYRGSKPSVVMDVDGEYQNQQYEKWLQSLSVHDTLGGTSMKTPLYQSDRIIKGLDQESAEYANLRAAMDKVKSAEKLLESFNTLSKTQREKDLDEVLGVNSELCPPSFQAVILRRAVRDLVANLSLDGIDAWAVMVNPFTKDAGSRSLESCPDQHATFKFSVVSVCVHCFRREHGMGPLHRKYLWEQRGVLNNFTSTPT